MADEWKNVQGASCQIKWLTQLEIYQDSVAEFLDDF